MVKGLHQCIDFRENLRETMVFTTVYGGFKGIGIEGITRDDSGTFPNDGFKGKCFLEPIEKDN